MRGWIDNVGPLDVASPGSLQRGHSLWLLGAAVAGLATIAGEVVKAPVVRNVRLRWAVVRDVGGDLPPVSLVDVGLTEQLAANLRRTARFLPVQ